MLSSNILTVNINLYDETGTSVNISRVYGTDVPWTTLMDQFIDTLRSYGYIVPELDVDVTSISIKENGQAIKKTY